MTVQKSMLLSFGAHAVILPFLFLVMLPVFEPPVETAHILHVRLRPAVSSGRIAVQFTGASPAATERDNAHFMQSSEIPETAAANIISNFFSSVSVPITDYSLVTDDLVLEHAFQEQQTLVEFADMDPLAGMDLPADFEQHSTDSLTKTVNVTDRWSVSWADGSGRGIAFFPKVDPEKIPPDGEPLFETSIRILVSQQGNVLSAVIVPPGSGSVSFDRYLHSLALQLVLEPVNLQIGEQHGVLRLVFQEGVVG